MPRQIMVYSLYYCLFDFYLSFVCNLFHL